MPYRYNVGKANVDQEEKYLKEFQLERNRGGFVVGKPKFFKVGNKGYK